MSPCVDSKLVVQHFGQRRQAVGRAAGIGNNRVFGRIINVVIDPNANGGVRIFGRALDENSFCAAFGNVQFSLIAAGEEIQSIPTPHRRSTFSTANFPGRAL